MGVYTEILADQRPFTIGVDDSDRHEIVCNFSASSDGDLNSWEDDLATLIINAGLGTFPTTISNGDLFIGPKAAPQGDGPFTVITDTGGVAVNETRSDVTYEHPSAQVMVTGRSFTDTRTRALAIWRALRVRNITIT